jgi:hypothetical protein
MHALVVHAAVTDPDASRQSLRDDIVPRARDSEGFVSGYWLAPIDGNGLAVIVYESEDKARAADARLQEMIRSGEQLSPFAKVESSEVREVVADA